MGQQHDTINTSEVGNDSTQRRADLLRFVREFVAFVFDKIGVRIK